MRGYDLRVLDDRMNSPRDNECNPWRSSVPRGSSDVDSVQRSHGYERTGFNPNSTSAT